MEDVEAWKSRALAAEAALKEAERLLSHRTKDMQRWIDHHDARAQAAEAKLETARRDALEEAIAVCRSLTFTDTTPPLRIGARMCAHKLRALQTKDTTP